MTWILVAISTLGVYWTALGLVTVLWAVWALVRLPFDLRRGPDD